MDNFNFDDLSPRSIPVKVEGRDYALKEASAGAAVQYRNSLLRGTRIEDGKVCGMDGLADAEPLLVSLCLFDSEGKLVPLETVRGWPNRLVKPLFDWVQANSDLKEGDKGPAKNGPSATTAPSV